MLRKLSVEKLILANAAILASTVMTTPVMAQQQSDVEAFTCGMLGLASIFSGDPSLNQNCDNSPNINNNTNNYNNNSSNNQRRRSLSGQGPVGNDRRWRQYQNDAIRNETGSMRDWCRNRDGGC